MAALLLLFLHLGYFFAKKFCNIRATNFVHMLLNLMRPQDAQDFLPSVQAASRASETRELGLAKTLHIYSYVKLL